MTARPSLHVSRTGVLLAGLMAVAALLRLINADAGLWYDEIVTVLHFVRAPLARVVSTYGLANNHVLNSVLANLSGSLFGEAPWAIRLPAILFGIGGVWAFWLAAGAIWPRTPALVGTGLFAVSYHHVYYSQNARGYSALVCCGLLSTACVLRLMRQEGRRDWRSAAGCVLATALGLYAMLLMAFIVAGQAIVLVAWRRWRVLGWVVAGALLGAALYLPMGPSLLEYYRTHPADTGHPLFSREFWRLMAPLAGWLAAAGAVMLPFLLRFARRDPPAAALLMVPLVLNALVPLLRGQGVYPRSFIFGLAVAYLLLVEVLDWAHVRRPIAALAIALAVGTVSFARLVPYYSLPKQGFHQALAYIEQHRAPGEQRFGITLGGTAAQFYDPAFEVVGDAETLRERTHAARPPAWIVSTFLGQLRDSHPDLYAWLQKEAWDRAEFPGVVGDGTVHVHYWAPTRPAR